MKQILLFLAFILFSFSFGQESISGLLKAYNKNTIPYISIKEFKELDHYILLDTREQKEFNISHLKNANCVGFDYFDEKKVKEKYPNDTDTIVVYCSVGIRSEIIGAKLKKIGYKNVYNLYGGIFDWKNKDQEVVDSENKVTESIHTFSKKWSKYLLKGKKIY